MEKTFEITGLKIAVTGPECSGKTTLAGQLGKRLKANVTSEYAREYLKAINRPYRPDDLLIIASEQIKSWSVLQKKTGTIADTDLTVIKIWYEWKFGPCPDTLLKMVHAQDFDHYLLCAPDLPWMPDPQRENPSSEERQALFTLFESDLKKRGLNYSIVSGVGPERLKCAYRALLHAL